jgi:hypothetical protein
MAKIRTLFLAFLATIARVIAQFSDVTECVPEWQWVGALLVLVRQKSDVWPSADNQLPWANTLLSCSISRVKL